MSSKRDVEVDEYEFELKAYAYIAGGEDFEILPIPDMKGDIPTPEEFRMIALDYKKYDNKLLYRVSQGDRVVVFSLKLDRVGIFPENHEHGFPC